MALIDAAMLYAHISDTSRCLTNILHGPTVSIMQIFLHGAYVLHIMQLVDILNAAVLATNQAIRIASFKYLQPIKQSDS